MGPRLRRDQQQRGTLCVAGALALVAILFAIAYATGGKKQAKIGGRATLQLKASGDFLRKQLRECSNRTKLSAGRVSRLQGESAEFYHANRQLEQENDRLVRLNDDLERSNLECEEDVRLKQHAWQLEDQTGRARLEELKGANAQLQGRAQLLGTNKGQGQTLLTLALQSLQKQHQDLRRDQGLLPATVDRAYVDGLVAKWREIDAEMVKQGKVGPMSQREGEVLPPNASEISPKTNAVVTVLDMYDPDVHAKSILIPKQDRLGNWQIPGWNGRYGTQPLRHGTYVNSRYAPVTDINRQMRVLYEYGLCAVANNITQFMYPTAYKRCKDCHTEYLHNYIETPLVLFCDDCRPQHNTNTFKLLCAGNTAEQLYGSELFWRMRSRLRFKGRFFNIAYDWLDENRFGVPGGRLKGSRTLAVRLPRGEEWAKACNAAREAKRPVLSYSKLLKAKDGVVEHSDDHDEQCMPPWSVVYSKINARAAWLAKDGGDAQVKVYISSGPGSISDAEWYDLQTNVNYPIFRRLSHGRPTEDDIVDSLIAACSERLILNRFDIKSSIILEAYQLWNSLMVGGTHVW
eukprot:TRINITY_DN36_c0_g2_i2.p1 TRINITY_DN36_c0_g2~~TRINITY_DN36_c0_g2_i2.p1  ORF type:complete len:622 (+),score=257.96 TRINITY_DN36_c0_g2_i2:145-1866(+)